VIANRARRQGIGASIRTQTSEQLAAQLGTAVFTLRQQGDGPHLQ